MKTRNLTSHLLSLWLAVCACLAATQLGYAADSDPAAEEIVRLADAIRFPRDDFQVDVTITSLSGVDAKDAHKYQILSKGQDNTLVNTVYPPAERGQILLMKDRDLWVFMPNVSQPIRLSLAQRLTGLVANGDLTRANFTGDYRAKLERSEVIDGAEYQVLELTAVDRSVTYHRVVYWVNKQNSHPYKAEFYTVSGKLMKTCFYTDFQPAEGSMRPMKLVMKDALREGEGSVLIYSNMQRRPLPDKVFTKDYLKKLQ